MVYNPFEVLEVPEGSSLEVCKSAYRRLVKKYHPDVCKLPDADKKFMLVKAAWDFLNKNIRADQAPQIIIYYTYSYQGGGYTVNNSTSYGQWY